MPKRSRSMAEKQWLSDVAALGCIACRKLGFPDSPAEIHHITTGVGMGQRASDYQVIPLCPTHHRQGGYGVAIHSGRQAWESIYGTEAALLEQTKAEIDQQRGGLCGYENEATF